MNAAFRLLFVVLVVAGGLIMVYADDDDPDDQIVVQNYTDSANDSTLAEINSSFETIRPILERSCFDCHTTRTNYPWYHGIPIIKGMIDDHIQEGLEHLDMTNGFPFGGYENQAEALEEIREEIEDGEMPLWSYRLIHWGTKIEGARKDSVFAWIDQTLHTIESDTAASNK